MFECVYLYIHDHIDLYRYFVTLFNIPKDGHDHGEDDQSSGDEEAKTLGSSGAVVYSAGGVILFGVGLIMMA